MNTLYDQAYDKVSKMGFTRDQIDFIFSDWPEGDDHYRWLLRADRMEIIRWGESSNWGKEE